MELKTNETNYTSNYETENAYPNPNDALFNQSSYDEPYQVTSTYSSAKAKPDMTNVIITIALLVIGIGAAIFFYNQKHKYDGRYELVGAESGMYQFTVEELELYAGTSIEASFDVKGDKVYIDLDYFSKSEEGYADFKVDGDKVTLGNGSDTMYGTYDRATETIRVTEDGVSLIFEKVD